MHSANHEVCTGSHRKGPSNQQPQYTSRLHCHMMLHGNRSHEKDRLFQNMSSCLLRLRLLGLHWTMLDFDAQASCA